MGLEVGKAPRRTSATWMLIRTEKKSGYPSDIACHSLNMQQNQKPGSLIIVGSGIESIGQFTLQALSYIHAADKVFYCVVDPSTEAFIHSKNKNCVDLYQYYDNGKPRMQTYLQMAEV